MPKKVKNLTFEEGLERLREIAETLESGAPTLSETINLFEEGVAVARHLETLLADAETKVEKLTSRLYFMIRVGRKQVSFQVLSIVV